MIDLHSHTDASDGQLSPEALLQLAATSGVTTLAVTDHDTVAGIARCQAAAKTHGIRLIPGIEVSIQLNRREVHVLGHFLDPCEARLIGFDGRLMQERDARMEQMVAKMQGLGFPVSMEQVRGLAGTAHLGRPHLARVMVELGYCRSVKEAFDRFLKDGGPGYVPRAEVSVDEALALIHGAGGTATVAHPGVSRVERHELELMRKQGLDGLEVLHSDHPPSMREKLSGWARELDLVATAGSDFHGAQVAPKRHLGAVAMSPQALAQLEARRR